MVDNFHSLAARLGRLFGGSPIYIGHPDDPALADRFPDRKSYGWIMDMEAREDGLHIKPQWSGAGLELLTNAHFKWFSPRWGCEPLPGVRVNGQPVVEPVEWVSLGLTNVPNIQGIPPLANETQQTEGVAAMLEQLIQLLGLAPDATPEQIIAAVTEMKNALAEGDAGAKAAIAEAEEEAKAAIAEAEEKAKEAVAEAETNLANERKARIDLILANAIAAGKITLAQRPQWAAALKANFAVKLLELANMQSSLSPKGYTGNLGLRNSDAQASRDEETRRDKVLMLVNERIKVSGEDYTTAYAAIRRAHPALFESMKTPGK